MALGNGGVEQRYNEGGEIEYYDHFTIKSFYPAPYLVRLPTSAPKTVVQHIERSFSLYWVDTSAAATAIRASLEVLLDEVKVPREQAQNNGEMRPLSLHRRIELWEASQKEYADLCYTLKEVGNIGAHGEEVRRNHYTGILEIYAHVLFELYENNSTKIKKMAEDIRAAVKKGKPTDQPVA